MHYMPKRIKVWQAHGGRWGPGKVHIDSGKVDILGCPIMLCGPSPYCERASNETAISCKRCLAKWIKWGQA